MNPITPPLVQLASYGPGWAMLAVFAGVLLVLGLGICGLLKWILEKQYTTFREDHRDTRAFTTAAIESLRDIKSACERCHLATVSTIKLEVGHVADQIINEVWNANETVIARTEKASQSVVTALGREEDRTMDGLRNILQAVQRDNDLSRPHAVPILGVGSQVRDATVCEAVANDRGAIPKTIVGGAR
jgi:hypothetical protein